MFDIEIIAIQVGVAIEDEERISQLRKRLAERAARAERDGTVEYVPQADAPPGAVAEPIRDHFTEVSDQERNIGQSMATQ